MRKAFLSFLCFSALSSSVMVGQEESAIPLREAVSFKDDIKPLFAAKCVHCHNRKTLPDLFSLESAKLAMVTLKSGQQVIVPGEPAKSLIVTALESPIGHEKAMPMVGPGATEAEIELIRRWIGEGAEWPKGPAGRIRPTFRAIE